MNMKNKVILLIAVSAIVTLSFTFASSKRAALSKPPTSNNEAQDAPVGGFALEDKL
jgi:hypothetical protein